jgi:putative phosphoesterase
VIVGILSDTHDHVPSTQAGVELLRQGGAEYVVHCGDVGSELVLEVLAGVPAAFVFGNNDVDRRKLERFAGHLGISCLGLAGELDLGGKLFHVQHGDDARAMRTAQQGQRYDYLLHGHTHVRRDDRAGRTRIINPGALYRPRGGQGKSVALLDTETDRLTFLPLAA